MAEALAPLAIVGSISACAQLASSFARLVKIISKAIRGIRNIPDNITRLRKNVELFSICLSKFTNAAEVAYANDQDSPEAQATARAIKIITGQGRKLKPEIEKYVREAKRKAFSSTWAEILSKIGLALKEDAIQCLQLTLDGLVSNMGAIVAAVMMETLLAQIRELQAQHQAIPAALQAQIDQLKNEIAMHKAHARVLRHQLKHQAEIVKMKEAFSDQAEELRNLNRVVERKVAAIVPELANSASSRKRRSQRTSSIVSSSPRDSGIGSSRASPPRSTPPTSSSNAGQMMELEPRRWIREAPPREVYAVPVEEGVPDDRNPGNVQETRSTPKYEIGEIDFQQTDPVEETAPTQLRGSTVGPVILVDEHNVVEEMLREWHPEAGTTHVEEEGERSPSRGSEASLQAPEAGRLRSEQIIQERNTGRGSDGDPSYLEEAKAATRESVKEDGVVVARSQSSSKGSLSSATALETSSSIVGQDYRRRRVRHAKGRIGGADVFPPDQATNRFNNDSEADNQKYRPMPPFVQEDRRERRKGGSAS